MPKCWNKNSFMLSATFFGHTIDNID